jgi:HD-GYP domain-containing protein (c-di-GMP phosphodiesterase class II)
MRDQDSLLELAAIKDFDDYTYAHSINVSVYSLTLGTNLGMDRPRLSQLGFAALFHDIGKVRLDRDLIQKPDSFDENDWIQMQRHPILGAKTILRTLRLDEHTVRAARGALEHHINADFTGYPSLRDRRPLNLFSRIITIADTFDALTSGRVYFKKSIPPDQVIKKMRYQMGMKFDVTLLELFNRVIGIYPVGSVVLLNTDEIAIIVAANEGQYDRPQVQIIGNRDGILGQTQLANLANAEHLHRHIVRIVEPDRYGINVRDFILAEI